jgi:HlyD family secretion protein
MSNEETGLDWNLRRRIPVFAGVFALLLLFGGGTVFALLANVSGAVIVPGDVEASDSVIHLQSEVSGRVVALHAVDGDVVRAGDPLVLIESSALDTEVALVDRRILELEARRLRLIAEKANFDERLVGALSEPRGELTDLWYSIASAERHLFDNRREMVVSQTDRLDLMIVNARKKIASLEYEREISQEVLVLYNEMVSSTDILKNKGWSSNTEVVAARRNRAATMAEIARIDAQLLEYTGQILDIEVRKATIYDRFREAAAVAISDIDADLAQLRGQRSILIENILDHKINSPHDGQIFNVSVGVDSVVATGAPLLSLARGVGAMQIRSRLPKKDIHRVRLGQEVRIKFPNFNQRTTPEARGAVAAVSAETILDERSGEEFFDVVVNFVEDVERPLAPEQLTAGLPVQVFIVTEERSVMDYLIQPVLEFFDLAFREP